jgi:hypothetical protein
VQQGSNIKTHCSLFIRCRVNEGLPVTSQSQTIQAINPPQWKDQAQAAAKSKNVHWTAFQIRIETDLPRTWGNARNGSVHEPKVSRGQ